MTPITGLLHANVTYSLPTDPLTDPLQTFVTPYMTSKDPLLTLYMTPIMGILHANVKEVSSSTPCRPYLRKPPNCRIPWPDPLLTPIDPY